MVVPRSASPLTSDDEFVLYAVTTFKKHSPDFIHKCREHRWVPREYKHVEGGKEEEQKEIDRVSREERKLWGEILRLGRTGWGEAVMVWIHVLALRVFVETVLRYGLPLEFVAGLIQVRRPLPPYSPHQPLTRRRQPPRTPKKPSTPSMGHIHTSAEMRSGATRRVGYRRKMTRPRAR